MNQVMLEKIIGINAEMKTSSFLQLGLCKTCLMCSNPPKDSQLLFSKASSKVPPQFMVPFFSKSWQQDLH